MPNQRVKCPLIIQSGRNLPRKEAIEESDPGTLATAKWS
jgi:hypothetical protein